MATKVVQRLWPRRRLLILQKVAENGGTAKMSEILRELEGLSEFTDNGGREQEERSPAYRFEKALWKLKHLGFIEKFPRRGDDTLNITDAGRKFLENPSNW